MKMAMDAGDTIKIIIKINGIPAVLVLVRCWLGSGVFPQVKSCRILAENAKISYTNTVATYKVINLTNIS